ncbi:hypothetical protein OH77DRAFT_729480 [Trametes cingulata]|nr:hypothetical protein OH77DRAFT_729480 [Trametes cingulata]
MRCEWLLILASTRRSLSAAVLVVLVGILTVSYGNALKRTIHPCLVYLIQYSCGPDLPWMTDRKLSTELRRHASNSSIGLNGAFVQLPVQTQPTHPMLRHRNIVSYRRRLSRKHVPAEESKKVNPARIERTTLRISLDGLAPTLESHALPLCQGFLTPSPLHLSIWRSVVCFLCVDAEAVNSPCSSPVCQCRTPGSNQE